MKHALNHNHKCNGKEGAKYTFAMGVGPYSTHNKDNPGKELSLQGLYQIHFSRCALMDCSLRKHQKKSTY